MRAANHEQLFLAVKASDPTDIDRLAFYLHSFAEWAKYGGGDMESVLRNVREEIIGLVAFAVGRDDADDA